MSRNYAPLIPSDVNELMDLLGSMLLKAPTFVDSAFPDMNVEKRFLELDGGLQNVRAVVGEDNYARLVDLSQRARTLFESDPEEETGETHEGCRMILQMWELLRDFVQ